MKQKKSTGEPLVIGLEQDDPPGDLDVDDPGGIPHTLSHWTLSRAGSTNPEDDDDYVELIAPDQTIVDWPARAMPKGVPAGSKLRFEVSIISGPKRTKVCEVTFAKGKLGLGLDQVRPRRPRRPHNDRRVRARTDHATLCVFCAAHPRTHSRTH